MNRRITNRLPFDYYPRGRVENRKGRIIVYLNPDLNHKEILAAIWNEFELNEPEIQNNIQIKSDGSAHYRYKMRCF